jgi:hypothetical protein
VERGYAEWDGAHFGEAAVVTTDAQHTVTEIVFDKAMVMGARRMNQEMRRSS